MSEYKALLLKHTLGEDLGKYVEIARSIGKSLFKTEKKVTVVDLIERPYGLIAVVAISLVDRGGARTRNT